MVKPKAIIEDFDKGNYIFLIKVVFNVSSNLIIEIDPDIFVAHNFTTNVHILLKSENSLDVLS